MTLLIGQRSNRRCRHAFTLVELIFVMVLLVVAVSLVAPRMSGFMRGRALDSESRRLLALTHAGQARAVSEGMPMVLWLDEKQNGYGLEEETSGKNGDANAEDFTVADNVQLSVLNVGGNATTTVRNLPAIRFLADGSVDENSPQTLRLMDSGGAALWLIESRDRRGYEISNSEK
jgi:type II secretion system protein H